VPPIGVLEVLDQEIIPERTRLAGSECATRKFFTPQAAFAGESPAFLKLHATRFDEKDRMA
jgi:hypothetical protein